MTNYRVACATKVHGTQAQSIQLRENKVQTTYIQIQCNCIECQVQLKYRVVKYRVPE